MMEDALLLTLLLLVGALHFLAPLVSCVFTIEGGAIFILALAAGGVLTTLVILHILSGRRVSELTFTECLTLLAFLAAIMDAALSSRVPVLAMLRFSLVCSALLSLGLAHVHTMKSGKERVRVRPVLNTSGNRGGYAVGDLHAMSSLRPIAVALFVGFSTILGGGATVHFSSLTSDLRLLPASAHSLRDPAAVAEVEMVLRGLQAVAALPLAHLNHTNLDSVVRSTRRRLQPKLTLTHLRIHGAEHRRAADLVWTWASSSSHAVTVQRHHLELESSGTFAEVCRLRLFSSESLSLCLIVSSLDHSNAWTQRGGGI